MAYSSKAIGNGYHEIYRADGSKVEGAWLVLANGALGNGRRMGRMCYSLYIGSKLVRQERKAWLMADLEKIAP